MIKYLVVTDNLRESIATASNNLLDNVTQVVNQEIQRLASLSDGAKLLWSVNLYLNNKISAYKSIHGANDLSHQVGHIADQAQQ